MAGIVLLPSRKLDELRVHEFRPKYRDLIANRCHLSVFAGRTPNMLSQLNCANFMTGRLTALSPYSSPVPDVHCHIRFPFLHKHSIPDHSPLAHFHAASNHLPNRPPVSPAEFASAHPTIRTESCVPPRPCLIHPRLFCALRHHDPQLTRWGWKKRDGKVQSFNVVGTPRRTLVR